MTSAGGFLVQAMPGATPGDIGLIEQHINQMHTLAGDLALLPAILVGPLGRVFRRGPDSGTAGR